VLLGKEFTEGVVIFQILVVGRLIVFVGQIYAWGLAAVGLDTHFVLASLLGAVSSVSLNLLLIPKYGLVAAAIIAVFVELLVHGYSFGVLKIHVTREIETLV
jgi:O-antigen/teichoic acid export membrane protein